MYREASDAHAGGKIELSRAPVVYGLIPAPIANILAGQTAFMDGLESMNLRHGKRTHCCQIANLFHMGLLESRKELQFIVDQDAWGFLLDTNPMNTLDYRPTDYQSVEPFLEQKQAGKITRLIFLQLTRRLAGNAPHPLHHLLVTGQLSNSLQHLHQALPAQQQHILLTLLGIKPGTDDSNQRAIQEAIRGCRTLETYTADSYFKNIDKILKVLPQYKSERDLNNIPEYRTGDFFSTEDSKTAIKAKLKRQVASNLILAAHEECPGRPYLLKVTPDYISSGDESFLSYQPDDQKGPKQVQIFERTPSHTCCRIL